MAEIDDAWHANSPYLQDSLRSNGVPPGEWHSIHGVFYRIDGATLSCLTMNPFAWHHRAELLRTLAHIMDAAGLAKVYVMVPYSAMVLRKLARFMGFRQEGRLRNADTFHGIPIDIGIYGILRHEVDAAQQESGLRRRRHG